MVSWDTASTLGEASDHSVGTVWGLHRGDVYLLDLVRGRHEVPDLRRLIEHTVRRHETNATVVEETDIGRAIVQEMRRHSTVQPTLSRPRFDKEPRLLAQAPKFEAGQVLLPREALWLAVYLSELLAFPNGSNDDQVDSTSQALNWWSRQISIGHPRSRPNPQRPAETRLTQVYHNDDDHAGER
jgi:predicted phage terminase large subunit-like protein